MTVASETNRSGPYNGNGVTTVFNYEFRIISQAHLRVVRTVTATGVETTLTLDADYTVSGVGASGGGQITTLAAPAVGETITILRKVPFVQETDLENQGAYYAETVETVADLSVMRDQELQEQVSRAVTSPLGEAGLEMPTYDAGKALAWDTATRKLMNAPVSPGDIAAAVSQAEGFRDQTEILKNDVTDIKAETQDIRDEAEAWAINPTDVTPGNPSAKTSAETAAILLSQTIGTSGYLDTPTALYQALADPILPLPSFIDGWTMGDLCGIRCEAPTAAGIPADSMGALQLEYTVSGAAGAASLAISAGDESKGTGIWAGVIQHDDSTYGFYRISSLAAGACAIYPNLRATVTAKTLRNVGGSVNGQHWTEPAYKALARRIFAATRRGGYRARYAAKWDSLTGVKADWTNTGGLLSGQYAMATVNPYISYTSVRSNGAWVARGRTIIRATPAAPYTGKGLTKSFALGGHAGVLEMFVSAARIDAAAGGGFYPFRVVVTVDGVGILDQTYTENDGLKRILLDYPAGTTGAITVTAADETWSATSTGIYIGDVIWWTYDRLGITWTNPVIDKNVKTVVIGDSWTTFYPAGGSGVDGVLGTELQAAMTAAAGTGTVVSVGQAGQDAEFGLTVFDTLVTPEAPKQVVILYFTNDHNTYGDDGWARWLTAMYKLGRKCQAIGARPIFIMPLPTSSLGQAIGHGVWADELGYGLPI